MNLQSILLTALVLAVAALILWRRWQKGRRQTDKCATCSEQGCIMKTQMVSRSGSFRKGKGTTDCGQGGRQHRKT